MSRRVTDHAASSLRQEHDQTLSRLSARASIFHFAHAAVSIFIACIMGGAAFKLASDLEYAWAPSLSLPALVISVAAGGYGLVRLVIGRIALVAEHREFARLKTLREQLELDRIPALPTQS